MSAQGVAGATGGGRYDLLRIAPLRRALRSRTFQFLLIVPTLFAFTLVIVAGLFGTPVGNANFATVFVWIVWWALLIVLLIPFGGRAWCAICPIPAVGEWVQRGAVLARAARPPRGLERAWPRPLRNIWLQNFAFLGVAVFSAVILTRPAVTAWLLLGFVLVALALHLVYRRRAFCRYVCPVGGFIGVYSTVAPLELRAIDEDVCLRHCGPRGKECITGSAAGYGCPWSEYPGTLARNVNCGLCMECVRTCPLDNLALNVRPFGADLLVPERRMDEAYRGLIALGSAAVYSAVMLGPWGWLKDAANLGAGSPGRFLAWVALLLGATLAVTPGAFYVASWAATRLAGGRSVSVRRAFVTFAYTAVPLGLAAWVAFSMGFVLTHASYAVPVLSDPLGRGWDLFGTASRGWTPYFPQLIPYVQAPTMLLGLAGSIVLGSRVSAETFGRGEAAARATLPVASVLTMITLVLLWLFMG